MTNPTTTTRVPRRQREAISRSSARRSATAIAGFAAVVISVLATAPAAFAMRVDPPQDGGIRASTTTISAHHGTAPWELTLIAATIVVLTSLILLAVVRTRSRIRSVRHATN
jgi:hypothetical protein